jgi:hypothetical protein
MPRGIVNNAAARAAKRIPGLKRLPILKLLAAAEILLLLRDHVGRLEPAERRRVVELVRKGRGRTSNLSRRERDELAELVAKAEPRLFVVDAADKLSPVPLPKQLLSGKRA